MFDILSVIVHFISIKNQLISRNLTTFQWLRKIRVFIKLYYQLRNKIKIFVLHEAPSSIVTVIQDYYFRRG